MPGEHAVDQAVGFGPRPSRARSAPRTRPRSSRPSRARAGRRAPRGRSRKSALDRVGVEPLAPAEGGEAVPDRRRQHPAEVEEGTALHMLPAHGGAGYTTPPRGSTAPAVEGWFAANVGRRRAAARFERISGGRSNLTFGVTRRGRRPLGAAPPAARQAARLGPRHGPRAPRDRRRSRTRRSRSRRSSASARTSRSTARPSTSWSSSTGPILRSGRGRRGLRRGRAPGDRRAGRRHAGRDPRRRPRRGRPRRARPQGGLRRAPAEALAAASGRSRRRASCRCVDDVHERLAGADPRAGPGDDRPRRLPPRQHDPRARRARSPRSSTGSSARSATRSPTSACCSSTGRSPATSSCRCSPRRRSPPGFPSARRASASRYAERSGRDLSRDRLLRRARLLEAGDHPRGRLRPLRRRASTARPTRASRSSPGSSSAWPRRPTRPSAGSTELRHERRSVAVSCGAMGRRPGRTGSDRRRAASPLLAASRPARSRRHGAVIDARPGAEFVEDADTGHAATGADVRKGLRPASARPTERSSVRRAARSAGAARQVDARWWQPVAEVERAHPDLSVHRPPTPLIGLAERPHAGFGTVT